MIFSDRSYDYVGRLVLDGGDEYIRCHFEGVTFDCRNTVGCVKMTDNVFVNCWLIDRDGVTNRLTSEQQFHEALSDQPSSQL